MLFGAKNMPSRQFAPKNVSNATSVQIVKVLNALDTNTNLNITLTRTYGRHAEAMPESPLLAPYSSTQCDVGPV